MDNHWYKQAECKKESPELFFGKGQTIPKALKICNSCPVLQECRAEGDKTEEPYGHYVYGVRGGETREDRLLRRGWSIRRFEIDRERARKKALAKSELARLTGTGIPS